MRRLVPLLAALPLLAGCPIDQPLPSVGGSSGFPPPRISFELLSPKDTIVDVSKTCPSAPQFTLKATVVDENVDEGVDARWFVDYRIPDNVGVADADQPPPSGNASDPTRPVRDFVWSPLDYGTFASPVHVVELVVSNGFWPLNTPGLSLPNRSPQPNRETQVFRWVFRYVDSGGACQ